MIWAQLNRFINNFVLVVALITVTGSGVYFMGYPWTCGQALKKRSEAHLRLRNARASNYPPGSPYRQYRESEKKDADALAEEKCESVNITTETRQPSKKFFLKDRSDY